MRLRLLLVATIAVGTLSGMAGLVAMTSSVSGLVGRVEAIQRLEPLVDRFEVDLSGSQRRSVVAGCLQIQATILDPARERLPQIQANYDRFLGQAGGQIWVLTNHLEAFADDASSLNLAMVELRRFRLSLVDQIASHDRNLQTAVAINCIAYPNHFVAGLYQIQADRQQLIETTQALAEYVETGLPAALVATECHLFNPEDKDC